MLLKTIATAAAFLGFAASSLAVTPTPYSGIHNKKGVAGLRPVNGTTPTGKATVQITYHGGPIMTGKITGEFRLYRFWPIVVI